MKLLKIILILFITVCTPTVVAQTIKPLPVDKAFSFSAMAKDEQTIVGKWRIAPQHMLYKDKIHFKLVDEKLGTLSDAMFPIATTKYDANIGDYQVYQDELKIAVPIMTPESTKKVELLVCYQGCSISGYCYPPITKKVSLNMQENFGVFSSGETVPINLTQTDNGDNISNLLQNGKLLTILLSFLGFGLLLSFTPCVLPMVPILSGIIVGHGHKMSTHKAFYLSSIYVLSMALTYSIAGMLVGYVGSTIQVLFQQPWILMLSSLIFVFLALSMFGFYDLQLPKSFQSKLATTTNKLKGGSYISAALMGCIATLVLSPCVTPALVGALAYIGKTGDALLGGVALFSLGLGMGLPLIAIGTAHGNLLPKVGRWMNAVKNFFGVMLLAMAIWILNRLIPGHVILFLWGCLLVITSMYVGVFNGEERSSHYKNLRRGFGIIMLVYGILLAVGAGMGNTDPFKPLANLGYTQSEKFQQEIKFTTIKTVDDFKVALTEAKRENKNILLDFYADWCIACQNLKNDTFPNEYVKPLLSNFILLQANVTRNDQLDKELQSHFNVIAPPTILFFKPNGKEIKPHRIIGEVGPHKLMWHLQEILEE